MNKRISNQILSFIKNKVIQSKKKHAVLSNEGF